MIKITSLEKGCLRLHLSFCVVRCDACAFETQLVPVAALKNDLVILNMKEAAAAQARGVLPFKDRPCAVLEQIFDLAVHLGLGEFRREHVADGAAAGIVTLTRLASALSH